ncbi:hypothetical protein Tco_0641257 [Tanacetum coccineum]
MPRWPSRKEEACGELEFTRSLLQVKMRRKYEQLIYSFKWTIKSNLEGLVSDFMASQDARLSKFEADFKRQQGEMTNKIDTVLKAITDQIAGTLPSDTVKNPKLGTHPVSIECPNKGNGLHNKEPAVEYFDTFPTRDELTYHRLSQVVLGRPFVVISNMTHDPPKGVVRFIKGADEVAYKMPHKIEQYDSLSDLEKEHTKSVYLMNEEDKRRGVELYLMRRSLEALRKFHQMILEGRFN